MAISPTGPVSTLVPDAPPQPASAPTPAQSTQADVPSQAVTPPSTDTGVDQEAPRDRQVDVTV